MIKNRIIELYPTAIKELLYTALNGNKNIMYTRNERSTPVRTKTGIENVYTTEVIECKNNRTYTIVINPDKAQVEYFDYKISNIAELVGADTIQDLKEYLQENNKEKFIKVLNHSNFNFSNQYDSEVVYQYILSLS